ncbi:hypothetical protein ABMA28_003954 [Loxostege sticticalis]|uniref:Peptidase S1 domain-containing protein n=1 Tax=Loxostege sticticalis TaxID=481309 RepID=A0ABD0STR4_LOXSC
MAVKCGIIFITLVLGCLAIPTPQSDDLSQFFEDFDDSSDGRIVGGMMAPAGSHPWMVALTTGTMVRSFSCGGSVLTQRTVLTAAHCLDNVFNFGALSSSLRVTVGTNSWNQGGQTLALSGNATHPHYMRSNIKNDLAMLYTVSNIVFNNLVRPITLSYDFVGAGVQARAAGWGRITANHPSAATNLMEIVLPTIDGERCIRDVRQASWNFGIPAPPVEPHIELCTFHSRNRGTCRGDSGSPLVRVDQGTQIGVVSWGFPCARGAPDMFVRISAFQSWINQHTR